MPAPRSTPVFLTECAAYQRYLQDVTSGALVLPSYEESQQGLIVWYGEVFCRVNDCERRKHACSATNNLRAHLERHGLAVAPTPSGRLTQADKKKVMTWYANLFEDQGEDEDQNENEEELDGKQEDEQ